MTTATLARPSTVPAAAATPPATTVSPATTPPTTLPPTTPAPTTVPTTVPTTPAPTTIPKVVPGRVVLVGDSVMAALDPHYTNAAREVLGAAGWKVDIDAAVNRSTIQGGSVVAGLHPGVGDTVVLATSGHLSTSPDRRGQIMDVLGESGHESYLVRWSDGRLSYLSPTAGRLVPAVAAPAR